MIDSQDDEQIKEKKEKIIEKIREIEKRMEYLLQKEKEKLLAEVDDAVAKRKSMMPNLESEE